MTRKRGMRELREAGEQFLQYLKDTQRAGVTNKVELKVIYEEFKQRDAQKKPNFSSAMYGLKVSGRAYVKKTTITFYDEGVSKRWPPLTDQYFVMRKNKRPEPEQPLNNGNIYTRSEARRISKWISNNRSQFLGKNDIHISSDHDHSEGRIRFKCMLDEEFIFPVRVENKSAKPVSFIQYSPLQRMNVFSFSDAQNVSKTAPLILNPGDSYEIRCCCIPAYYGYYPVTLVCEFMTENDTSSRSVAGRFISAVCTSKLVDELKPTSKYVPYQKDLLKPSERIEEDGFHLDYERNSLLEMEIPLGQFPPPQHVRDSISAGVISNNVDGKRRTRNQDRDLLNNHLDFNNYKKFHLLLYLEEIQMEIDIRKYDQRDLKMEVDPNNKRLLTLKVLGVAENRPSVLKGDHLFATFSDERDKPRIISYKGYVHGVELERVKLGFSQNLYDRSLESNQEQCSAVNHILSGKSRPAPYIIFGPPGTGKTVTLVEAIKQVLKLIPDAHVLACAPSNSASDLLCERLLKHVNPKDIYRIMALSRDIRTVPEDIKICTNLDSSRKNYIYPCKQELKKYKVIVSTLLTSSRLVGANFPHGHFTHVFIDEAGHAVEPECVTAIAGIVDVMDRQTKNYGGQVVLVGDQQQLGPVLRSPVAIEHGLGVSFLERLMTQNPLYSKKDGKYNPQFVTKLLKNYRSHPSILKIPNELFYDNELQAVANELITHSYCKWETLPKKDFPIIFHGVLGVDEREEKSPSFFNCIEIQEVISYLEKLLKTQGKKGLAKISPKEIGIISPYRKQVEKISKAVHKTFAHIPNIKDLKIGSVEEFQGQERKVIIVSTVRSSKEFATFDENFSLGFVKNPKRFNVAITRAKSLLILVGNPLILGQDPYWSQFLNYCYESGGSRGFHLDSKDLDENVLEMFSQMNLDSPPPGEETGESYLQQQVQPAWRHDH
uniref:RNA helicase n=1 Tax=Xenopus tropicalis TaxID=8364 RepID=A0A803J6K4_XENTR